MSTGGSIPRSSVLCQLASESVATGGSTCPEGGSGRPRSLVSWSYGQMISLELFPYGVIKAPSWVIHGGKGRRLPGGGKRGKIEGFSIKASGRLREFLMTMHVPGRLPWAVTLTSRRCATPDEWRTWWHRFRDRARRCLTAAVYKVELQRRKAPHIHSVVWIVDEVEKGGRDRQQLLLAFEQLDLWHHGWLDCITPVGVDGKRVYDWAEYQHACHVRKVEDEGWAIYQALHHGKNKKEQCGWKGKQWGVIGRGFFKRRRPVQLELNLRQYWRFRRLMSRLLRARGARFWRLPAHGKWVRCIESSVVEKLAAWCKSSVS